MKSLFLRTLQIFVFLLWAMAAQAEVHLISWQSEAGAPRLILPRLEGETPEQAVERYQKNLTQTPDLDSLVPSSFHLSSGMSQDLPGENFSGRPRLALIANWLEDMTPQGDRIQRNIKTFSQAGADPYVIALAADLGLSDKDIQDYRDLVAANFSLLVSLGGDDVAPELYNEETTFAKKTNLLRDQSELGLVRNFKKYARGVFFGICRGHQMGAVADGHTLYQDLTQTGAGSTEYHIRAAGQTSSEKQQWHDIEVQDSLLLRFLQGQYQVHVNSVHHQAVRPNESADSFVVALDDKDGIVEGLQGKNGKSLSVQFHPEFPSAISGDANFSARGFQVISGIVQYARLQRQRFSTRLCRGVFL